MKFSKKEGRVINNLMKNIVSVIYTLIKMLIFKLFHLKTFHFKMIERFSPNTTIEIGKKAKLFLGNRVRAHSGTRIRVRDNATVVVGNDVAFNYNCLITAKEKIVIGDGCEIGPGVLFYDHDHDVNGHSIKEQLYKTEPIIIGKDVWIGANVIILRGTQIGDNCVVAAGTVVKGKFKNNILIRNSNCIITSDIEGRE